jgi:WD40 repeat protein
LAACTDAGDCLQEFAGHKGGVNALAAVAAAAAAGRQQQQQQQQQHSLLLSAGKDHKLKLWDLGAAGSGAAQQQQNGVSSKKGAAKNSSSSSSIAGAVRCVAEYVGHKDGVQAVAAHPDDSWCCSGGWDGQLLLWKTGEGSI